MAISSIMALFQSFVPGFRLVDGQDLYNLALQTNSAQSGVKARAGGGAAGAPLMSAYINEVATVTNNNDSVLAPLALAGAEFVVINDGANSLRLYAQTTNPGNAGAADGIVALAGGAAAAYITVAANAVAVLSCYKVGTWKSQNQ